MNAVLTATTTDLSRSGLEIGDIRAREIGTPEAGAIGLTGDISGYVIPYYGFDGNPIPFYRVRLFGKRVRYLQPKNTSNHIYFPPGLKELLEDNDNEVNWLSKVILICEGEKKALCAVKNGVPAVGLGGVDSWRNRTAVLPANVELFKLPGSRSKDIGMRLPSGHDSIEEVQETPLASGFTPLINYMVRNKLTAVITFDSDHNGDTTFEVQRAASALGFEMRYLGLPYKNVRQLILPIPQSWRANSGNGTDELEVVKKVGVDDYIITEGAAKFVQLIKTVLEIDSAFPLHPNVRDFVNKRLSKKKLSRKEAQQVAMSMLCDLDTRGKRLKSTDENQTYYFDFETKRLLKVMFNMPNRGLLHETHFGQLLYSRYGVSAADQRVLTWLDAQFNSEQPLEDVKPSKVFAVPRMKEDYVTLQLSDSEYIRVNGNTDKLEIFDNGSEGILFESGHVKPIDVDLLRKELIKQKTAADSAGSVECWWDQVLDKVRLRGDKQTQMAIALMYYISPWLTRWRGTQLPVELVIGEAGSGKSSLCELRLDIITGQPDLRNAPTDLKDWHASIVGSGGLHVTDNLQLVDKQLRQRLSDELCRLVTEPFPHVEMRKLYSNAELIKLPVAVTFAITSIQQPFNSADILQRSFLVELDKGRFGDDILYDNTWVYQMLTSFGGREAWLAHHLCVLQLFFREVHKKWNPRYRATHRLINVEQSLSLLGSVFGIDTSWIPSYLGKTEIRAVSEADWTMEGLIAFKDQAIKFKRIGEIFTVRDVSDWCSGQDDFVDCIQLTNPRKLGRHIKLHSQLIKSITGIEECGTRANRTVYHITT